MLNSFNKAKKITHFLFQAVKSENNNSLGGKCNLRNFPWQSKYVTDLYII